MLNESDVGVVDCYIATMWNPDYAFDDASLHDYAVDPAMLAVRCHEAG